MSRRSSGSPPSTASRSISREPRAIAGLALTLAWVPGALASGFEGVWTVSSVQIADAGSEWVAKSRLPSRIEIRPVDGRLQAVYTDQTGIPTPCSSVREVIEGNELQLSGCAAPIKGRRASSPMHRVQLRNGRLQASVVTDKLIYTWSATREP